MLTKYRVTLTLLVDLSDRVPPGQWPWELLLPETGVKLATVDAECTDKRGEPPLAERKRA